MVTPARGAIIFEARIVKCQGLCISRASGVRYRSIIITTVLEHEHSIEGAPSHRLAQLSLHGDLMYSAYHTNSHS